MKVKLGFSVASHLKSEIVIMDEVLAVGDVNFQNKCINRMKQLAAEEGRTILYVSHNMATVKSLCNRCVVLKQGQIEFIGSVEESISVYVRNDKLDNTTFFDVSEMRRSAKCSVRHKLLNVRLDGIKQNKIDYGTNIPFIMQWKSEEEKDRLLFKMIIKGIDLTPVGISFVGELDHNIGVNEELFVLDTSYLVPGMYSLEHIFYNEDEEGNMEYYDRCICMRFEIVHSTESRKLKHWFKDWGNAVLPCIKEKTK